MIDIGLSDGIIKITMNGPPVSALGVHLRRAIANAIDEAQENTAVLAIVITGSGQYFSAGADINEFDEAFLDPSLPDVIGIIEASRKPVVAAINGFALGGGLEVALGCHYRLAVEHATLGLPEVNLGLLPGAGGTQRLPRLVGAEIALELIVSGAPISGTNAAGIGLVDQLSDGSSLIDDAMSFARSVQGPRRTGALPIAVDVDASERTAAALSGKSKTLVAPKACIEAVRAAAESPISEGLALEQRLFRELVAGDQSKALRHVFFAERASAKVEGLPGHSLFWADQIGLATIVRELTRYAAAMGNAFTLSPLLEKCAAEGHPLDR